MGEKVVGLTGIYLRASKHSVKRIFYVDFIFMGCRRYCVCILPLPHAPQWFPPCPRQKQSPF